MKDATHNGRSILILMHAWVGFLHGVQRGITRFIKERPLWTGVRQSPLGSQIARLGGDHYDGVITFAEEPYLRHLRELTIPVVNVSNGAPDIGLPAVFPDEVKIGQLAAEHLTNLGLPHFACVAYGGATYSRMRREAFAQALPEVSVHHYDLSADEVSRGYVPQMGESKLLSWLTNLPKPVGLFATSDARASEVLQMCRHAGLNVPQDICVLGVDNDEFMTDLSTPPLSSVELPIELIGYEAARLLDRLMEGEAPPAKPIVLPPVGVVARQSTNILAITDLHVLEAVHHIRDAVADGVTVPDLLRRIPLNRRYFEQKFKKHLGRTPLQEILRVRIERAKELLRQSDLSMPVIARRSGFRSPEQLATVFRRLTGATPTHYRRQHSFRD